MGLSDSRQQEWAALLELSRAMLEAARAERWETVLSLQAQRTTRLDAFFAEPAGREEADVLAEGIRRILAQDREIMARGASSHAEARSGLQRLACGRRAVHAYSTVG